MACEGDHRFCRQSCSSSIWQTGQQASLHRGSRTERQHLQCFDPTTTSTIFRTNADASLRSAAGGFWIQRIPGQSNRQRPIHGYTRQANDWYETVAELRCRLLGRPQEILLSYSQYLEEDARHPVFLEQQRCVDGFPDMAEMVPVEFWQW